MPLESVGTAKEISVILVALAHGDGRHNQNLVAVYETGLMCLSAGNIYAVRRALYNVQEQIRISLLGRSEAAVALNVGHCAVYCQIFILNAASRNFLKFS